MLLLLLLLLLRELMMMLSDNHHVAKLIPESNVSVEHNAASYRPLYFFHRKISLFLFCQRIVRYLFAVEYITVYTIFKIEVFGKIPEINRKIT